MELAKPMIVIKAKRVVETGVIGEFKKPLSPMTQMREMKTVSKGNIIETAFLKMRMRNIAEMSIESGKKI